MTNTKETFRKLRNIYESNFKILAKISFLLLILKAMDNKLNDPWLTFIR
jgi:hypothetical protein